MPVFIATQIKQTTGEWLEAILNWRASFFFALEDLLDRYRRSYLGLAWIVATFLLFVGTKILIFGAFFPDRGEFYSCYLIVGFTFWLLISSIVTQGSRTLVASAPWILATNQSYFIYYHQVIVRCHLEFLMTVISALVLLLITGPMFTANTLFVIPAIIVYPLTALWVVSVIAPLCVRFRDLMHAIDTIIRVAFFLTPIFWVPTKGTILETVALYNPLTHYLAIVREPLMGMPPPTLSWIVVALISVVGFSCAFWVHAATKDKVTFWI